MNYYTEFSRYINECKKWNNDWEKFIFKKLKIPIFLTLYDMYNTNNFNHMNYYTEFSNKIIITSYIIM